MLNIILADYYEEKGFISKSLRKRNALVIFDYYSNFDINLDRSAYTSWHHMGRGNTYREGLAYWHYDGWNNCGDGTGHKFGYDK